MSTHGSRPLHALIKPITDRQSYLSIGAAGVGVEAVVVLVVFWVLLASGVWEESRVRGTFPMRYQIPMLFNSLLKKQQDNMRLVNQRPKATS